VRPHGIRELNGDLLIPLRDVAGELHALPYIAPNGEKRFPYGARVRGCYHSIGKPNGTLCIAEGFATASA